MEKLFLLIVTVTAAASYQTGKCLILSAYAIESPQYRVVHSESDYEIRLYKEMSWMSALVLSTSFHNSTKDGFHRLYQYIHGANQNSTQFMMTAPVLTSITPMTPSLKGFVAYTVRYYLPSKFDKTLPPQPSTELNLQLDKWKSHCIAVRKFGGYANDENINREKDALLSSLAKHLQAVENKYNYSIAQYNASKHPTGRINEVWMDVSGFTAEGCPV